MHAGRKALRDRQKLIKPKNENKSISFVVISCIVKDTLTATNKRHVLSGKQKLANFVPRVPSFPRTGRTWGLGTLIYFNLARNHGPWGFSL